MGVGVRHSEGNFFLPWAFLLLKCTGVPSVFSGVNVQYLKIHALRQVLSPFYKLCSLALMMKVADVILLQVYLYIGVLYRHVWQPKPVGATRLFKMSDLGPRTPKFSIDLLLRRGKHAGQLGDLLLLDAQLRHCLLSGLDVVLALGNVVLVRLEAQVVNQFCLVLLQEVGPQRASPMDIVSECGSRLKG